MKGTHIYLLRLWFRHLTSLHPSQMTYQCSHYASSMYSDYIKKFKVYRL